ncbi:MAG: prepilin-type N-terminal cleavage/methylation domain-containing protein [Verrucomicrobiota bacterium]
MKTGSKIGPISRRRGFTLIEILMAIFLGGLILLAASSYLFALFNIKLKLEERPAYEEHVKGVIRFLDYAFIAAEPPEGESGEDRQGGTVTFAKYPGADLATDESLSFRLSGELPLFVDPEEYLSTLTCYLVFNDDDGLSLIWQSDSMAEEDDDDLRRTQLSPYVTSLIYAYYDAEDESWEESEEPEQSDNGGLELPDMIKLVFTHPETEAELTFTLILPPEENDVPLV